MVEDKAYQATPDLTLERQIMDSNVPKNEREWWARNEIERLREALKKVELRSGETHIVDLARSALQQKDSE